MGGVCSQVSGREGSGWEVSMSGWEGFVVGVGGVCVRVGGALYLGVRIPPPSGRDLYFGWDGSVSGGSDEASSHAPFWR